MTITLSNDTWSRLSTEYLTGGHWDNQSRATANAYDLSQYVCQQVLYARSPNGVESLHYLDIKWVPVNNPEPYDGLESLEEAIYQQGCDTRKPVQVSDCYHDHPVFTRIGNLCFRVWHDTGHYLRRKGFDPTGELELFVQQAQTFGSANNRALVDALFSESVYQLAACVSLGGFPDEQHVRTPGPVARALLDAWGL